ncbi:MAG: hypothetical protein A2622_03405 [Bdellovibrionales bacterium RIFCSPHIGHO2_01_FULL_40_29]|nr:MAG: hypothetical protein A2622_03405 [Bdellovibrionales bacterium RIFCSPHIGHO2_01_FULL_40_29]OFZ34115.1 MAG: hypothetical protein A3D17_03825 [Bdellovibrionales bacterium RIFCSPHIGHO2_02_FULL_40_15]
MLKHTLLILLSIVILNCATKPGPEPEQDIPVEPVAEETAPEPEPLMKYSDMNNMAPPSDRNYRRMTRQTMEEEAELQASSGSLWVMEGQTSYLFSQNKHRNEGDPTAIKVEGTAMRLIENKVAVIQDLMKELDAQRLAAEEENKQAEEEKLRLAEEEKFRQEQELAKTDPNYDPFAGQYPETAEEIAKRQPAEAEKAPAPKPEKESVVDLKDVASIPSRIVEKTKDGMYRIRGQQFLTIKKKPYKVIATGLIRVEDFDDNAISSNKLRDAQFDVIHIKRTE